MNMVIAIMAKRPRNAMSIPGEYVGVSLLKMALEATGAKPHNTTTPINTRKAINLVLFIRPTTIITF